MGREIGARTLVSEIGQSVDLPVKARCGPRSSRLAPWWLPKAVEPTGPSHSGPLHRQPFAVSACGRRVGSRRAKTVVRAGPRAAAPCAAEAP
jgi:hypothetical protein